MPRRPRVEYPDALYHVIARGNNKQEIFHEHEDYKYYIKKLRTTKERYGFYLYSYCIMPNHIHLLVRTRTCPLSHIMRIVQTSYAGYYNRKYKRVGHVFQGRYISVICDADRYLLELIRYIHLNPVRAGIVDAPQSYPWSSHNDYLQNIEQTLVDSRLVLPMFSKKAFLARQLFSRFVLGRINDGSKEDLHIKENKRFLGDKEFVEDLSSRFDEAKTCKTTLKAGKRPSLKSILETVAEHYCLEELDILSKGRSRSVVLSWYVFIYIAKEMCDFQCREIADILGRDDSLISHAVKSIRVRFIKDKTLKSVVENIYEKVVT